MNNTGLRAPVPRIAGDQISLGLGAFVRSADHDDIRLREPGGDEPRRETFGCDSRAAT